ncbi:MAG: response regulator [Nitrospira sp.]
MRQLRIVLAEKQPQVLHFLKMFPEPNYDVVAAVRDSHDLTTAVRVMKPDIVVMNIDMPKLNGLESVRQIHKIVPDCRVILKSSRGEPESMAAAYAAGASAYVVKGGSSSLEAAIRVVIDHLETVREWDQSFISRELLFQGQMSAV